MFVKAMLAYYLLGLSWHEVNDKKNQVVWRTIKNKTQFAFILYVFSMI